MRCQMNRQLKAKQRISNTKQTEKPFETQCDSAERKHKENSEQKKTFADYDSRIARVDRNKENG